MNCIISHPSYVFVFTWYEQCLHLYQGYSIFHSAVHELFNFQCNEILCGWSKLLETVMKITSTEARPSLAIRDEPMDFGRQSHTSLPLSIVGFVLSYDVDFLSAEKKTNEYG